MNHEDQSEPLTMRLQRGLLAVWVVLLILAIFPFTHNPAGPIKELATAWLLVAMAGLWCYNVIVHKAPFHLNAALAIVLGFVLIHAAAALLSPQQVYSLHAMRLWALFFFIALYAANACPHPDQSRRLLMVVVVAASAAAIYGLAQYAGFDPFPWSQRDVEEYRALPSTFANPNFAAHTLALALLIALGLLIVPRTDVARDGHKVEKLPFRWYLLPLLLLMATHFYLTHMRGGRLAILAALAFAVLFLLLRLILRRPLPALVAAVTLSLAGAAALAVMALTPVLRGQGPIPLDSSIILRLNSYYNAVIMFFERPILGWGPGGFQLHTSAYWTPFERLWFVLEGRYNTHVHNDLLESAVEAGLFGAFAYLALILWAVVDSFTLAGAGPDRSHRRLGLLLGLCFVAFAVDGLFSFNLRIGAATGIFFLLLGLLAGLRMPLHGIQRRGHAVFWSIMSLVVVIGLAYVSARTFRAEMLYQRALGAITWEQRFNTSAAPAMRAAAAGTRAEARRLLEEGAELLPWDARFPEGLARLAMAEERWEDAILRLQRARFLNPAAPWLLSALSESFLRLNEDPEDLEQADTHAREALERNPLLPTPWAVLGEVAMLRAERLSDETDDALLAEAEREYLQALRYGIENEYAAWRALARLYSEDERLQDAADAYERALLERPQDAGLWDEYRRFAQDYRMLERYMDSLHLALRQLHEAAAPAPEAAAAVAHHMALAFPGSGEDPDLVRLHFEDLLRLGASELQTWGAYISTFPHEERWDAVRALVAELAEQEAAPPMDPAVRPLAEASPVTLPAAARDLSNLVQRRARELPPQEAERVASEQYYWLADILQRALGGAPLAPQRQAEAQVYLGEIAFRAGRWQEARELLEPAAEAAPRNLRGIALARLSALHARDGEHAQALALGAQAVEAAPGRIVTRWNWARRLVEAERYQEADFEYLSLLGLPGLTDAERAAIELEQQHVRQQLRGQEPAS